MRLYRAVCTWLEAHAQQVGTEHEPGRDAPDETAYSYTGQPGVAGFSQPTGCFRRN